MTTRRREASQGRELHQTNMGPDAGAGTAPHSPQPAGGPSVALADDPLATLARVGKHLVWTMPPDGVITDPVPAWCAFTGQSPEMARGDGWTEAVHPDDRVALLATIAAAIASQQPFETEYRLRRYDGVWRQMLAHGTPVYAADGSLREWVGVCTDVSEERAAQAAREDALEQQRAVVRQQRRVLRRLYAELRREHEAVRLEHTALQGQLEAVEAARQTRDALRASETHFQRLVAGNLIGVVVADQDRVTEANDAFLHMVGYTREDLEEGRVRWRKMTPPEYAPLDAQGLAELVERGECTPFEKELWRADGSRVPILIGATLLERDSLQWVCFVMDLSERQRLEQEAVEQAAELEAAFDALGDALFVYDTTGQMVRMNPAGQALLGLEGVAAYADGHRAPELGAHLEVRDAAGHTLAAEQWPLYRALSGETLTGSHTVEVRFRSLDGREGHTSVSAAPIRDAQGAITGAVLTIRDVTEQRRLEEQLRFQASMLARTHDAIFVWELGGPITYWNEGAHLLYGYQAETAVGQRSHELLRTVHPLPTAQEFEAMLLREGEWTGELTHTARDGRVVEVLSRHQVLRERDGRVYVLESSRDITERKRLEHERMELLGLVAHDLGNPLTSLKAQVQMLQRRLAREAALPAQALGPAVSAVQRMERLVGDLRARESLETGQFVLAQKPFDLARLCREEVDAARTTSGRAITLALPSSPVKAQGDRDRIGQVLANLLSNALKYSPADRPVSLTLTTEDSEQEADAAGRQTYARVAVRDEGPGIRPDALPHLFERFYRVPGITVQHGAQRSLGLGLYICRQLVERHGGQMGVESTVGEGSTFWFTLPLAQPDEQERPHAQH